MDEIDFNTGLTSKEVEERRKKGLYNYNDTPKTKSIGQIIRDNLQSYMCGASPQKPVPWS